MLWLWTHPAVSVRGLCISSSIQAKTLRPLKWGISDPQESSLIDGLHWPPASTSLVTFFKENTVGKDNTKKAHHTKGKKNNNK